MKIIKSDDFKIDVLKIDDFKTIALESDDSSKNDNFKISDFSDDDFSYDDLKNENFKNDDLKNDDFKSDDLKNDDLKNDDLKNDDLKNDDLKKNNFKKNNFKISDLKNDDFKNDDFKNDDAKNDDFKISKLNTIKLKNDDLKSNKFNSSNEIDSKNDFEEIEDDHDTTTFRSIQVKDKTKNKMKQKFLRDCTQLKLNKQSNEIDHQAYIQNFTQFWIRVEMKEQLNSQDRTWMSLHEQELCKNFLETDVCVMICMTTINDDLLIQEFKVDHVILQKIIRLQNVEIFVDMIWAENATTIHMSEDDEQLSSFQKDVQEKCFTFYLNRFLFDKFMTNDYFHQMFKKQYCIISILDNIISKIWYRDEVLFEINIILHSNIVLATVVLNIFCDIAASIAFININSKINVIDVIKFKQNDIEVKIEFSLIVDYIKAEIFSMNILLLVSYSTQIALFKKRLMSDSQTKNVKTCTIDVYQEKEKLMIIFMMIEDTKIEFQSLSDHLLVECNRSRDSFVVIVNWLSLQVNYSKRLHLLNELKVEFEAVKTYTDYDKSSTDLDFMTIEH